ncbi:MAG: TatD family hydrolase, partial [Candidatus Limnocylindrales bacterium]
GHGLAVARLTVDSPPPIPTLDAHAHLDPSSWSTEPPDTGAVLAMSLTPEEFALRAGRADPMIAWGVGCHPGQARAQATFDPDRFRELVRRSAVVGEVGLDGTTATSMERQVDTFRTILAGLAVDPRIASIHSRRAESLVLDELECRPIAAPILHWFQGTAAEVRRAVGLGCYFSVHSAVARRSMWRTSVPLDRLLVESDHGYRDPPAAIPLRVGWVEHLLADARRITPDEARTTCWRNLARIVRETGVEGLLPAGLRHTLLLAATASATPGPTP